MLVAAEIDGPFGNCRRGEHAFTQLVLGRQFPFFTQADHLRDAIAVIGKNPGACRELEIETYTWEVLPPEVRTADVADMIAAEYRWTLAELAKAGIKPR